MQYEIFGVLDPYEVQEMDTKPQVIDTLTSDESETLDKLMGMGIKMMCKTQQAQLSASAGSPDELPYVKKELNETFHTRPPKLEPLLSIYKLTAEDIQKIKKRLKKHDKQTPKETNCKRKNISNVKEPSMVKGKKTIKRWSIQS